MIVPPGSVDADERHHRRVAAQEGDAGGATHQRAVADCVHGASQLAIAGVGRCVGDELRQTGIDLIEIEHIVWSEEHPVARFRVGREWQQFHTHDLARVGVDELEDAATT